jgi:hypothetical protein
MTAIMATLAELEPEGAAPHRANPAGLGSCRRPSHRCSPPTGKSSSAGSPRPANP